MVALFVTIDILEIKKLGLNINEYLNLVKLRHDEENKSFPYEFDRRFVERLKTDGFIEYTSDSTCIVEKYKLGPAGIRVFEGDDLFEEFFSTFPTAVETGLGRRVISAKDPNSVSGKVTHEIWNRVTKNKPHLQRKIIDCLKRELEHKKKTNSLMYMQGIDTWLRQATWEKWEEDIPENRKSSYTKL
jgi:hypothetical protein